MDQHLKTKAFGKLTGVSVRTLQYYDEIGLLKPAYINEYGHRFYDAESFSKMFVILSLKEMGMELQDISKYLNGGGFQLTTFIKEEKHRVELAISDLQIRLLHLSELERQAASHEDLTPAVLSLFSFLAGNDMSSGEVKQYVESGAKKPGFNLKEWDNFIKNLNDCCEKDLPATDKRVVACITFWKEKVIKTNDVDDKLIRLAESYYQKNPEGGFGITPQTYSYLTKRLCEHNDSH